jgi:hypothetical protein
MRPTTSWPAPKGSPCSRRCGWSRATTTARDARCRPPSRPPGPGDDVLEAVRRPRPSWPGAWPARPDGGSEPGTAHRPFRVVRRNVGCGAMTLHGRPRWWHGPDGGEPPRPPARPGFSMRPAMIVPGIGRPHPGRVHRGRIPHLQPGPADQDSTGRSRCPGHPCGPCRPSTTSRSSPSRASPRATSSTPCPSPTGATRISYQNNSAAAQQYDAQITLRADDSQGALENFYAEGHEEAGMADLRAPVRPTTTRAGTRGAGQEGRLRRLLLGDGRRHLADLVRAGRWRPSRPRRRGRAAGSGSASRTF